VQFRLVARGGVLLDDAGLGGSVNHGKCLRQQAFGHFGVLLQDRPPHGADLVPQPGLVLAVEYRAPFSLPYPLERGISVRHGSSLQDSAWAAPGATRLALIVTGLR